MKITIDNTPEHLELIKLMGSRDKSVAIPAMQSFAAIIGPVVEQVLLKAGTANVVYRDLPFNQDDNPSFPVELWYNEDVNYVQVWYQSVAGGLPSSVVEGAAEMKFHTYRLDSSVAFDQKYARKANLPVLAKAIERMAQEVLIRQERNAWAVMLKALAEATTNSLAHVISATASNVFQVDDLNRLLTRTRRINTAWNNDTPVGFQSKGVTDLFISPEMKEQVRAFAYQPMNTRVGTMTSSGATAVPLPDDTRKAIYDAAGSQEIFGVGLIELLELGDGQKYNDLFDAFYTGSFTSASDQILVGVDLSRDGLIRPVETSEGGSQFTAQPDDQYVSRQEKVGFYGMLREGRVVIDKRVLTGIIV